jgi:hypothetical protein
MHIVLAGDSIFDNGAYVAGDPVVAQLRARVPASTRVTLLAVDGDVTADVAGQLREMPSDATHLVVSVGGNDALGYLGLLDEPATGFAEVLSRLQTIREEFAARYRAMLQAALDCACETAFCTIYDRVPGLPMPACSALALFNETILREVLGTGAALIDLRNICEDPADYAAVSPIEPSEQGGEKIVRVIARWCQETDRPDTGVFA